MANPVIGETPLVLADGRAFTLVLDHAGLVRAAHIYTGKTKLKKLFADMQPDLDADGNVVLDEDGDPVKDTIPATTALLAGALERHHPGLALRDVQNILLGDIEAVGAALGAAIQAAFPDQVAEGNGAAAAARRHGKSSGRSGARRA